MDNSPDSAACLGKPRGQTRGSVRRRGGLSQGCRNCPHRCGGTVDSLSPRCPGRLAARRGAIRGYPHNPQPLLRLRTFSIYYKEIGEHGHRHEPRTRRLSTFRHDPACRARRRCRHVPLGVLVGSSPQPCCHFDRSARRARSGEISCVRSVGSHCARDFSTPPAARFALEMPSLVGGGS